MIDAGGVAHRCRRLVNLATGIAIVTTFTVVVAVQFGQPGLFALGVLGVLVGAFASVEAARMHDKGKVPT